MSAQQTSQPNYWLILWRREADNYKKSGATITFSIEEREAAEIEPGDVAYTCESSGSPEQVSDNHIYGWGYVTVTSVESVPQHYGAVAAAITVEYVSKDALPVVTSDFRKYPELVTLAEAVEGPDSVVALTPAQAAGLSRLLRFYNVEAPPDPEGVAAGESDEVDAERLLTRIQEKYRFSVLSQLVLEHAGELVSRRQRYPNKITTSAILFAILRLGGLEEAEGSAARFLRRWFDERRSGLVVRRFAEFWAEGGDGGSPGSRPIPHGPHLSTRAARVVAIARDIARLVRREHYPDREEIRARDLLAALLLGAREDPGGATRRLGSMDVNVLDILKDYSVYLRDPSNEDDDLDKWAPLLSGEVPLKDLEGPPPEPDKDYIPPLDSDAADGDDLLDIKGEVAGFANIIAASKVNTPLSIGLFGDWGSGKSFFINKLKKKVAEIADGAKKFKGEGKSPYLAHIVQIDFNAWHYVEANLWASLVSHIFDNLKRTDDEDARLVQERKEFLLAQLEESLGQRRRAESEAALKRLEAEGARAALARAQSEQVEAGLSLGRVLGRTVWDLVREHVEDDEEAKRLLGDASARLRREGLPANLAELRQEIEATSGAAGRAQTYLSSALSDPQRWLMILLLVGLTLFVPFAVSWALARWQVWEVLRSYAPAVTPLLTFLGVAWAWLLRRRGEVNRALEVLGRAKQKIDELYGAAEREHEQEVRRLQNALDTKEGEVRTAAGALAAAERGVSETVAELRRLEPGALLEQFVSDRAASDDYRKLLGVVALIRRDFKNLSNLLIQQDDTGLRKAVEEKLKKDKEEREKAEQAKQAEKKDGEQPGQPAAGAESKGAAQVTSVEIDEMLEAYRIDRIVLYIDDLDRCPPKQVVDVLQAIHLLLAFELFVVVVGVDARWVRHSLRRRFHGMLGAAGEDEDESDAGLIKAATPRDYIEKIFQVPFWLRPMGPAASAGLLKGLIPDAQLRPRAGGAGAGGRGAGGPTAGGPQTPAGGGSTGGGGPAPGGAGNGGRAGVGGGRAAQTAGAAGADGLQPEALLLETKEKDAMLLLSKVIGRTPRTLKRFVNVYRIIRAGLRGEKLAAFRGAGDEDGHYLAVLVLLSVAHGAPDLAPYFFRVLEEWYQKQPAAIRKGVGLKDFLSEASRPPGADPEAENAGAGQAAPPGFSTLLDELKKFAGHYREDIPVVVLREWLPVVVRYTFQLGRMSEEFEAVGRA